MKAIKASAAVAVGVVALSMTPAIADDDAVKKGIEQYRQLETAQVSYGTIGPSLNNYGKVRGNSPDSLKYTWARLWNSHAFNMCNAMPKFGANGILKEAELKDLMALLHDPESVVNK